ncbi:MAG: rod shape-determining protein RodA [Proteobacteria bacterium]|nr:rod shape-determining protein RodA [Pseudomonadota bacterium]
MSIFERIKHQIKSLPRIFTMSLVLIVAMGGILLFDAAKGNFWLYSSPQLIKFAVGLGLALIIGMLDIRIIYKNAYWLYGLSVLLLVMVPIFGATGKGAQRWLDLGLFRFQPSELMKITLILGLAKFYHRLTVHNVSSIKNIATALLMIFTPAILVLTQPDLGTSLMLIMIGVGVMFVSGVSKKFFLISVLFGCVSMPVFWGCVMKDYQKQRVLTFMNPESDPLGSGYHIIQSKIAIGSSGFFGKGFMQGTQSHLAFLPEKHTDFIFALLAEDFGMLGVLLLMVCYIILILSSISVAVNNRNYFSSLIAMGVAICIFLYAFINMAMVTGLMPVVGVPLPFVSYGGTSMITLMIAVGLIFNASIQKEDKLPAERKFN